MAKKGKYYVRPDGIHEAIRVIDGKRVAFRGRTDRDVEEKMRLYKEKQEMGKMFAEVADEWEKEHEAEIAEGTRLMYGREVRRAKEFFTMPIRQIRPLDIKRYITQMSKKGYSSSLVGSATTTLKQIFSYAVIQGDIDVSPAAEIKKPKGLPKKKRTALTEDQEHIVKRSGTEQTAPFWLFPYLLLYTGLRRGEAAALTYADIDRKNMVIHVNKKVNYNQGQHPKLDNFLKSENGLRDVPLLPPLAAVLPRNAIGLIFPGKDGGYIKDGEIRKGWKEYCRAVGLDDGITPHCFRHSFATICFEAGLDPRSAARFLGDDVKTVEAVYTHLRDNKKESAAEKLRKYCTM